MPGSNDDDKPKSSKSPPDRSKKSKTVTHDRAEVGEVLWCESDLYLIIAAVFLLILGLFSFFGDGKSKALAALKLIYMIAFTAAVSYGVIKKHVLTMSGVLIATLVIIVLDIISILVSLFGSSTFGQAFVSIVFSIARIVFFVHFFFVASRVRSVYKRWQEEGLPR
ncbi:unnamed protein product [Cylicocyclus nassatus]|uniref:Uncharacterized protein n=1 Tax=Cylicocyclus nassatus TaxID=53992 RepID=A0AA36GYF1_CYLNA|nr:unnamed protein product [Cylicocyclus nassatus]